jgi:hypothetical protein
MAQQARTGQRGFGQAGDRAWQCLAQARQAGVAEGRDDDRISPCMVFGRQLRRCVGADQASNRVSM